MTILSGASVEDSQHLLFENMSRRFSFFGAEERKYARVCISPHRVEKGY